MITFLLGIDLGVRSGVLLITGVCRGVLGNRELDGVRTLLCERTDFMFQESTILLHGDPLLLLSCSDKVCAGIGVKLEVDGLVMGVESKDAGLVMLVGIGLLVGLSMGVECEDCGLLSGVLCNDEGMGLHVGAKADSETTGEVEDNSAEDTEAVSEADDIVSECEVSLGSVLCSMFGSVVLKSPLE